VKTVRICMLVSCILFLVCALLVAELVDRHQRDAAQAREKQYREMVISLEHELDSATRQMKADTVALAVCSAMGHREKTKRETLKEPARPQRLPKDAD
jgi:hypothetical protein